MCFGLVNKICSILKPSGPTSWFEAIEISWKKVVWTEEFSELRLVLSRDNASFFNGENKSPLNDPKLLE